MAEETGEETKPVRLAPVLAVVADAEEVGGRHLIRRAGSFRAAARARYGAGHGPLR